MKPHSPLFDQYNWPIPTSLPPFTVYVNIYDPVAIRPLGDVKLDDRWSRATGGLHRTVKDARKEAHAIRAHWRVLYRVKVIPRGKS